MSRSVIAALAFALCALPLSASAQARAPAGWVGAWAAPPMAQPSPANAPLKALRNQTVRQRVKASVGGRQLRVTLSNAYGTKPLVIGAATIGRVVGGQLDPASIRPLTFGGAAAVTIAPGAPALSDAVALELADGAEAAISLHLPAETVPETYHRALPAQDAAGASTGERILEAAVSGEGDFTGQATMPGATASPRLFVARLDVLQPRAQGAVVVLGTTRTVGEGRWYDLLAQRLAPRRAVVNASMVANPLTRPYPGGGDAGLARFDRDVLMVPGVSHVVIADSINDIGQPGTALVPVAELPTLAALQAAYRQLVERAHARGVKVIAATVLPFEGVPFQGFYAPQKDQLRAALNQWIRTAGIFDGVIDMDAILRDPANPNRYAPGLHTANNFAPSEAGERKLADAIDVRLFR